MNKNIDHILFLIISAPCVILFTFLFIQSLTVTYPDKSELQYETCTYVDYEHERHSSGKGRTSHSYKVYVEEYDVPLTIDNIVFPAVPEERFLTLKKGDKVTLSIESSDDKLYLYALSVNGRDILSYDEYLDEHSGNDKVGAYFFPIMIIMSLGLMLKGFFALKNNRTSKRSSKRRYIKK